MYGALIVGAGAIGARGDEPGGAAWLTHAHAFAEHGSFRLVGFVDPDEASRRAAAAKWGGKAFRSVAEAFGGGERVDVVSIASPDPTHYQLLKEVAGFDPRFVLTEKPLTRSLDEAVEIVELYDRRAIPAAVNCKRRFVPEFVRVKERIDRGDWGELQFGTSFYGKGFLHSGFHLVDLLRYFFPGAWTLERVDGTLADFEAADPSLSATLRHDAGATIALHAFDSREWGIFELDLFFRRGRVRIAATGLEIEEYVPRESRVFPGHVLLELDRSYSTQLGRAMYFAAEKIREFLEREVPVASTLHEGLETQKTIHQILEKAK